MGWIAGPLMALPPCLALGEIGPALTGLTGRANDATSVFFSPAGITRLDRPEVAVQATFMYQESKFDVQQASVAGGDSDKDSRVFTIPAAYYVHPLGERWRLGLSLNVPSGIGHDYGKKWSGRYLSESSDLAFVAASTVLAYRFTDRLSLGAGPYLVYTDSRSKARVNNLLPDYSDGSVRLEEDGAAFGYMLGVYARDPHRRCLPFGGRARAGGYAVVQQSGPSGAPGAGRGQPAWYGDRCGFHRTGSGAGRCLYRIVPALVSDR